MVTRTESRKLKVFLCYSRPDESSVHTLYRRLESDHYRPWMDDEDLIPGEIWTEAIARHVRSSDIIVVCLSPESITREGFVQREIRMALEVADEKPEGTNFLIPARLRMCAIPERLSKFHGVDLWRETGYPKLCEGLRIRAEHIGLTPVASELCAHLTIEPLKPYIGIVLEKKRTRGAFLNFDCRLTNRGIQPLTVHRLEARLTDPFNATFVFDWNLFYKTEGILQTKDSDVHPIPLQAGEIRSMGIQFVAPPSIGQYTWDSGRYAITILGSLKPPGAHVAPQIIAPFEASVQPFERERLRAWTEEYEAVHDPHEAVAIPVGIRAVSAERP